MLSWLSSSNELGHRFFYSFLKQFVLLLENAKLFVKDISAREKSKCYDRARY